MSSLKNLKKNCFIQRVSSHVSGKFRVWHSVVGIIRIRLPDNTLLFFTSFAILEQTTVSRLRGYSDRNASSYNFNLSQSMTDLVKNVKIGRESRPRRDSSTQSLRIRTPKFRKKDLFLLILPQFVISFQFVKS